MSLRDELRKLRDAVHRDYLAIEQRDGSMKRFPPSDFLPAFSSEWSRGKDRRAGRAPGPEHPLVTACKNARDPEQVQAAGLGAILMAARETERVVPGDEDGE